jgi:hypothetical protein
LFGDRILGWDGSEYFCGHSEMNIVVNFDMRNELKSRIIQFSSKGWVTIFFLCKFLVFLGEGNQFLLRMDLGGK